MPKLSPVVPKTWPSRPSVTELPWLLGVALGLLGLWWRGHAFVPLPFLSSYDWMEYVPSAWMVTHGIDLGGYATWRNPLYPAILGTLGEWVGYNEAAWLLGSIAMSLVVFSAGLGARALANPWAGLVAAVTVPFINPWAEASRWATLYPTLAAATGMSLACGAAFLRWRQPVWIMLAGASAGLAWGIDFRGIALVCAVAAMGVLGAEKRWGLILAIAATFAAGQLANNAVQISTTKDTSIAVQTQRELELRLAVESGDMHLVRACHDEPVDSAYPTMRTLFRPCAWAFVADNLDRAKDQAPFGVGLTLLLLPLVLIGSGRGWRGRAAPLIVFGSAYGALFLMAVWARLNVHHFVQFAAPIAMTVPVAVGRLLDAMGTRRVRAPLTIVLAALGLFWVTTQGPWAGKPVDDLATAEQHQLLGWMLDGMGANVNLDGGDVLMDCTGLGVEAALLPTRTHTGHPNFQPSAMSTRCQQWIHHPPQTNGRVWIFTRQEPGFSGPPQPPWQMIQAFEDGPRRTWLWQLVDTNRARP
jgi:hypothetical protein